MKKIVASLLSMVGILLGANADQTVTVSADGETKLVQFFSSSPAAGSTAFQQFNCWFSASSASWISDIYMTFDAHDAYPVSKQYKPSSGGLGTSQVSSRICSLRTTYGMSVQGDIRIVVLPNNTTQERRFTIYLEEVQTVNSIQKTISRHITVVQPGKSVSSTGSFGFPTTAQLTGTDYAMWGKPLVLRSSEPSAAEYVPVSSFAPGSNPYVQFLVANYAGSAISWPSLKMEVLSSGGVTLYSTTSTPPGTLMAHGVGYQYFQWPRLGTLTEGSYTFRLTLDPSSQMPDADRSNNVATYSFKVATPQPTTYTVTFNANGGSCATTSKKYTSGSTLGTLPTATKSGYTFNGWYTSSSGGTKVTSSTTVTGDRTLYAHWTAVQTGNPFGFPTTAQLAKTPYAAWQKPLFISELAPSSDYDYKPVSSFEKGLTPYVHFIAANFGSSPVTLSNAKMELLNSQGQIMSWTTASGTTSSLNVNIGETLVASGCASFNFPWNVLSYLDAGSYTLRLTLQPASGSSGSGWTNVATYPFKVVEATTYTIKFVKNEGSGLVVSKVFESGVKTRLPAIKNGLKWERRGYEFKGWATSTANAREGKVWKADWANVSQAIGSGKTLTVYAVWKLKPGFYEIKFNKNDGSGKWRTVAYEYGVKTRIPTVLNGLGWTVPGCAFGGWALSATGAKWKDDWAYVATPVKAGVTLNAYAIWEEGGENVFRANATAAGGTFSAGSAPLADTQFLVFSGRNFPTWVSSVVVKYAKGSQLKIGQGDRVATNVSGALEIFVEVKVNSTTSARSYDWEITDSAGNPFCMVQIRQAGSK